MERVDRGAGGARRSTGGGKAKRCSSDQPRAGSAPMAASNTGSSLGSATSARDKPAGDKSARRPSTTRCASTNNCRLAWHGKATMSTAPSPSQRCWSVCCSAGDALPGARHTVIELSAATFVYMYLMQCTSAEVAPQVWRILGRWAPVILVGCTQGRAQSSATSSPNAESSVCFMIGVVKAAAGKKWGVNQLSFKAV